MTRFIRHVAKGLLLMTAGYVLQRLGKWMQPKPREVAFVYIDRNDNTGWMPNSPELQEFLGRKVTPAEELN